MCRFERAHNGTQTLQRKVSLSIMAPVWCDVKVFGCLFDMYNAFRTCMVLDVSDLQFVGSNVTITLDHTMRRVSSTSLYAIRALTHTSFVHARGVGDSYKRIVRTQSGVEIEYLQGPTTVCFPPIVTYELRNCRC